MKQVVTYLRVSTIRQEHMLQIKALQAYKRYNKIALGTVYKEKATATNTDRVKFQAMMESARRGEIDAIIIWKLDRVFRNLADCATHIKELKDLGVRLISVTENLDFSTAAGLLQIHMLGAFAQYEAAMIDQRMRAGRKLAREKGVVWGKPKKRNDVGIWEMLDLGYSYREICKYFSITKCAIGRSIELRRELIKRGKLNEFIKGEIGGFNTNFKPPVDSTGKARAKRVSAKR